MFTSDERKVSGCSFLFFLFSFETRFFIEKLILRRRGELEDEKLVVNEELEGLRGLGLSSSNEERVLLKF